MLGQNFAAGDVIYREGDESDRVFLIEAGEVEVFKHSEEEEEDVLLAVLHRGEIFGEAGVVRDRPRGTTTRCCTAVKILVIEKKDFVAAFGGTTDLGFRVLKALCERLASADERIVSRWAPQNAARQEDVKRLRLLPASSAVAKQIGSDGIEIAKLPFRVGRLPLGLRKTKTESQTLLLHTPAQYQLAEKHFAIEFHDGQLVIIDLGSKLGTVVNGVRISTFEHVSVAGLVAGENLVIAGGLESPYRFTVAVE